MSRVSDPQVDLEERSVRLGRDLVEVLLLLLDGLPGRPKRPQEVARLLEVNKNLTSRVMGGLRQQDALASLHHLPGPVPLRQMVHAAGARGASAPSVERALAAIDRFDSFVRDEFGALKNLQSYLATRVPDAREELVATSKQAAFRGIAGIRGIEIETLLVSFIVYRSKRDPSRLDTTLVNYFTGIRRLHPRAHFSFSTLQEARDGTPQPKDVLLREFSSASKLEAEREGSLLRYTLAGSDFGKRSMTDLAIAEKYEANHPLDPTQGSENPTRWFFAAIEHPARLLVFDVLIEEGVWEGIDPTLAVFDTTQRGEVTPDRPAKPGEQLELGEQVENLRSATDPLASPELPRYDELLEDLSAEHDFKETHFRVHRVSTAYPLYGSQTSLLFRFGVSG